MDTIAQALIQIMDDKTTATIVADVGEEWIWSRVGHVSRP
jgi:hypothetical protein